MKRRTRGPESFDAVVVGRREADAWVAYYRREWPAFLRAAVGMVAAGCGLNRWDTVRGAWFVLRANQAWAPLPDNDPQLARELMRRFYALVAGRGRLSFDPSHAAALEVEWWRVHRERQHHGKVSSDHLVDALVELYAYVHSLDPERLRRAARLRVEAMDLSDAWVRAGCSLSDPLLAAKRRTLVASYAALLDAVQRSGA
jgi:hypothetical protein